MEKNRVIKLEDSILEGGKNAKTVSGGEIFALIGPLGSGKTTFTKAFGKKLGVKEKIVSPTYIIMNRYKFTKNKKKLWLYHLDLYRTKSFREVTSLGLKEIWGKPDTITVIEWADKIKKHLPKETQIISFVHK